MRMEDMSRQIFQWLPGHKIGSFYMHAPEWCVGKKGFFRQQAG
jgi:hypothetical protein